MKFHTGIAGITSADEVIAISSMLDELDPERSVFGAGSLALGVLASEKTIAGQLNRHPSRYPPRSALPWVFEPMLGDPRLVPALHMGVDTPGQCVDALRAAVAYGGPAVRVLQINAPEPPPFEELVELRRALDRRGGPLDVIVQIGPGVLGRFKGVETVAAAAGDAGKIAELFHTNAAFHSFVHVVARIAAVGRTTPGRPAVQGVLFDASAGQGKHLDARLAEVLVGACELALDGPLDDVRFGVAGGLAADTVPELARVLRCHPSTFVDAEGRLRTQEPGGGRLDFGAVRAYLAAVRNVHLDARTARLDHVRTMPEWAPSGWAARDSLFETTHAIVDKGIGRQEVGELLAAAVPPQPSEDRIRATLSRLFPHVAPEVLAEARRAETEPDDGEGSR